MGFVQSSEKANAVVKAVARGEVPWSGLARFGLEVGRDERGCLSLREPANLPCVPVTARDLACGFLAHQDSAEELRAWAFVVETSDCFDIGDVED
jgi:hypothetical protein